jgi:hypothetical protein
MSGVDKILAGYDNLRPGQEDFYRDLHRTLKAMRCPSTTPAGTTCTWPA